MRDLAAITDTIRQSVSAVQAGEALGLHPDRNGRCPCPAHNGKDRNCRLDKGERGWHCFVCGQGGDVISLVQVTNGCAFWDAVAWLNGAFGLGLNLNPSADKRASEAARIRAEKHKREREEREAMDRALFDTYCEAEKLVRDLEADKEEHRPRTAGEPWDERFVTALRVLPQARETLNELTMMIKEKSDARPS